MAKLFCALVISTALLSTACAGKEKAAPVADIDSSPAVQTVASDTQGTVSDEDSKQPVKKKKKSKKKSMKRAKI